jgi:phage portal protein BeeE
LPPVAGGDSPYMQQQNYSLEALAKRDTQEDPFGLDKPQDAPLAEEEPDEEPNDDEEIKRQQFNSFHKGLYSVGA